MINRTIMVKDKELEDKFIGCSVEELTYSMIHKLEVDKYIIGISDADMVKLLGDILFPSSEVELQCINDPDAIYLYKKDLSL